MHRLAASEGAPAEGKSHKPSLLLYPCHIRMPRKNYDSSWTLDIKLCFFLFAESTFSSRCRRREPAHITALPRRSCGCGSGVAPPEYTIPVMRFAAHSSMTLCLCKAFEDESDNAVTYLVWPVSPSFGIYWGIATSTYAIVQSQPFAMPGDNTAS